MGKSRSTTIGAALSKIYNGNDEEFFNSSSARMLKWKPNKRIYKILLKQNKLNEIKGA